MKTTKRMQTIYIAVLLAAFFALLLPQANYAATTKTITSKKTMMVGSTYTMKITANADYVVWTSGNSKVASVAGDGTITAKKNGTATITAKAVTNGTVLIYKCKVTVVTQQTSYIGQTINLINKERRKYGLPSFDRNTYLQKAAQQRAKEIAVDRFSQKRPNGTNFASAISMKYNFAYAAQSIACDFSTPKGVVNAWMANAGTKANIISKQYEDIGVGVYLSEDGYLYWVAIYGSQKKAK